MKTIAASLLQAVTRRATDCSTPASDQPMSILIVDDEEGIRRYLDRVLSGAGYRTTIAVDGADAIAVAAREGRFDLLLTDVAMPKMTGAELARRMRLTDPDLKVLYLTGCTDQLFEEKATLWREEAFLEKPSSIKAIAQAVALLLFGQLDPAFQPVRRTRRANGTTRTSSI